jgi:single-strand DNA-binding protein
VNDFYIAGFLTHTPALKKANSGDLSICEFQVAVKAKKETRFLPLVAYRETAENIAKYLVKGSWVAMSGKIDLDTWEKDGQKRSKVRLVVTSPEFGPRQTSAPSERRSSRNEESQPKRDSQDEIPF